MSWLFEALFQAILEPIVYAYFDFIQILIPHKKLKRWQKNLCLILCGSMFLISAFLIICGVFWSFDKEPFKTYGTAMWIIGASVIFINIVLAAVAHILQSEQHTNSNESIDNSSTKMTDNQDDVNDWHDELDIQANDNNEPTPILYFIDDER